MAPLYPHNRVSPGARAFLEATDPALPSFTDPLVMCEALYYLTSAEDPRASTVREMIAADYAPLGELVRFVALADVLGAPAGVMGSDFLCPVLSARLSQLCARVLTSADTLQPAELPVLRSIIGVTDAEDEYGAVFGLVEDLIFHPNYHRPAFEHDGFEIHNPYWDETGRFPVDPAEYYGQPAIAFLAQHPGCDAQLSKSPDNHV